MRALLTAAILPLLVGCAQGVVPEGTEDEARALCPAPLKLHKYRYEYVNRGYYNLTAFCSNGTHVTAGRRHP